MRLEIVERYRPLVDDWSGFMDALTRPLPLCVWNNEARLPIDELGQHIRDDGVTCEPIGWQPNALRVGALSRPGDRWWIQTGLGQILEEASLLPVGLLDPRPGERVLDLCAAPGSKTVQLSRAVGAGGTVVANDVSAGRLRGLRSNLDRLGLTNVVVTCHDGCNYPGAAGRFDRVLVDVPCSGEGTLRKNPRLVRRDGALSLRQAALLRKAATLCRPGGRIVYSTCTFAPEENEAVVDRVLRESEHLGLRVVAANDLRGLRFGPGTTHWGHDRYHASVERSVRLWPHLNDTGGFFVAVLERDGEESPTAQDRYHELQHATEDDWVPYTVERFGIDPAVFECYDVFRRTMRGVHFADRDLSVPVAPEPEAVGLFFVKGRIRYPKLTTSAALVLGKHASRNAIALSRTQLDAYLKRETFPLDNGQIACCSGSGYALLRYLDTTVGTGLYVSGDRAVTSLLPKRWSSR